MTNFEEELQKYTNILENNQKLHVKIKEANKKLKNWKLSNKNNFNNYVELKKNSDYISLNDKAEKLNKQLKIKNIEQSIQFTNILYVIKTETLPKIIKILKKYEGKAISDKTSLKISEELKAITPLFFENVRFWLKTDPVYKTEAYISLYSSRAKGALCLDIDIRFEKYVHGDNWNIYIKDAYIDNLIYTKDVEKEALTLLNDYENLTKDVENLKEEENKKIDNYMKKHHIYLHNLNYHYSVKRL